MVTKSYNDSKKSTWIPSHTSYLNTDITLLEASITISVTFSEDTLEDILFLLQNLLTDGDERPRKPGNLFFKTLLACS